MRRPALPVAISAVLVLGAVPLGALPGRGLLSAGTRGSSASDPSQQGSAPKAGPSKAHPGATVEHLALACSDHDREDEPAIACRWSKAERADFGSYRLLRSRGSDPGDRIVVFHTTDRDTTTFVDETIHPDVTYTYRVEAVDDSGQVVARSKDVQIKDRSPEPDHVRLACRDADAHERAATATPSDHDAESIGCRWTASRRPSFAGYRLLRSTAGDDAHSVVVFQTNDRDTTSYLDGTVAPDTTYDYVLEVVSSTGDVIDRSNVSRAGDEDEDKEPPRLACRDLDPRMEAARSSDTGTAGPAPQPGAGEQERIVCRWSPFAGSGFGSYQLTRSVMGTAEPAVVVFHTDDRRQTSFTDAGTAEGVTYQYVLHVLDRDGHELATSDPAQAGGDEGGPGPKAVAQQGGGPQGGASSPQPQPEPQPQPSPAEKSGATGGGGGGRGLRGGGGAAGGRQPPGGRDRRP